MNRKTKSLTGEILLIFVYLVIYALISGSFLTRFPFVHSDEAWLAGLTRDMQSAKSFGVTESFFDLKPRVAHAIKLLFHALQMGYTEIFGFNIQAVRLLSLTAALICLILLYRIGKELGGMIAGAGLMILVSLDTQFVYASHFARQEIILCVTMLSCLLILIKSCGCPSVRQALLLALLTGLSVGIHPNSFLLAAVCGCVLIICGIINKKQSQHFAAPLLVYTAVTGAIAAVFVGISFLFSPAFIPDYFRYGEQEFELNSSATGRIAEFIYYFKSIFHRESGTYYLPDERLILILSAASVILLILAYLFLSGSDETDAGIWSCHTLVLLAAAAGLTLGMIIIGRYNQTTIIFFLLLGWITILQIILLFERAGRIMAITTAAVFLIWNSHTAIRPYIEAPAYTEYLKQLGDLVPADARVIANLNTGFYFDQGTLLDYRNLPCLNGSDELAHYIEKNKIQYICLTDELDYIYENRPYYNVIYGNAAFIKDLKNYCETNGTRVGSFESPLYGTRIISLMDNPDYFTVTVYKVSQDTP